MRSMPEGSPRRASAPPRGSRCAKALAFTASSAGNLFEWYEFSLFGAFADVISAHFFPHQSDGLALRFSFILFWLAFLARPLGAYHFGRLGDRVGRIPVLLWTGALMLASTLGMTMIPSYAQAGLTAPLLLVLCRLLQGISLGGETGGGITFALESVEPWQRAQMGALFQVSGGVGSLFANVFSGALRARMAPEALHAFGWKIPFWVAAIALCFASWLRSSLHETAPSLADAADGGGDGQAVQEVGSIGSNGIPASPSSAAVSSTHGRSRASGASLAATAPRRLAPRVLWLVCVSMLWMVFGFWLAVFVPAMMTTRREPPIRSAYALAAIAQCTYQPALLGWGLLADWLGPGRRRRQQLVLGAALSAIAFPAASYVLASPASNAWHCGVALVAAALVHAIHGAAITPFVFEHAGPQASRLSTIALTWAIGATLFAGSMPTVSEGLVALTGSPLAPGYYIALTALLSICAVQAGPWLLGREADGAKGTDALEPRDEEEAWASVPLCCGTPCSRAPSPRTLGGERELYAAPDDAAILTPRQSRSDTGSSAKNHSAQQGNGASHGPRRGFGSSGTHKVGVADHGSANMKAEGGGGRFAALMDSPSADVLQRDDN